MSLKRYEAFVKTVEHESLTLAARELGSTQSRISHALSDMEEEYGFSLLQRSRGGVRLTEAGAMLYPAMKEILEKDQQLRSVIREIQGAEAGTVRLGAFTSVAVHWLPGMIRAFGEEHPKVEFKMFNGDYYDVEQWLKDGSIDLGFVALPAPEGTLSIPLARDELVAILPKGHPLAAGERVPIEEIGKEPFISLLQSSDHDIHRALDRAGIKPDVRFTTKDDYAIIAMVEQRLGVSIVPELLIRGRRDGIEVRPLEPSASRTIALAMRADRPQIPVVEAFAKAAVEWLKNLEAEK